jgi:hypothetical protein
MASTNSSSGAWAGRLVGHIAGHEIFAVEGVQYVPVSSAPVSNEVRRHEDKYLSYLTQNDLTRDCYFSYSYPLARTLQTNAGGCPPVSSGAATRAAEMFTWNHHLLHGGSFLSRLRDKSFAVPCIHGFFEQRTLSILSRQVAPRPPIPPVSPVHTTPPPPGSRR